MAYIKRWAETEYQLAETIFKAIIFTGVRQCGKTTLLKESLPTDSAYVSLDSETAHTSAEEAPGAFLMKYRKKSCLGIDEVQKVPALFSEIKALADDSPALRQYLLSGSSDYRTLPSVHESMAGRLGEVRLRPMTEGEIQGRPPMFFERLRQEDFEDVSYDDCNKSIILQKAIRGGFPLLLSYSARQRNYWFDAYVDAVAKKDLMAIGDFRKPESLLALLKLCAANSSRSINLSQAASVMEVTRKTMYEYLAALQTMFLIERLPLWQPRVAEQIGADSKLMLCDTGLMSHLVGVEEADALTLPDDKAKTDLVGNLIKTWVYQQLAPLTDLEREWSLFHFRNRQGKEIDFILENRKGDMICFEVKASEGVKSDHFKNLRWFREQFGKGRRMKTIVLYTGFQVCRYSDDEFALPMACLWQ